MSERRTYDGGRRRAQADERRARVLAIARERFLEAGYARTSLPALAAEAGVSTEYLHKVFGGKAGLLRATIERGLLGSGAVPAPQRSDEAQAHEVDGAALMRRFGAFSAEVAPLAARLDLLVREAAASGDATLVALRDELDAARYERMLHNARQVEARGFLRPGLTAEQAADIFWAVTASELYANLVLRRGWSDDAFGAFVGEALVGSVVGGP